MIYEKKLTKKEIFSFGVINTKRILNDSNENKTNQELILKKIGE